MIQIQKLTFEGFRTSMHSASVKFAQGSVTIIFGDNGSGKTTYLRAINAFLSQDSLYLESISVQSIECEYLYDEIIEEVDKNEDIVHKKVIQENLPGILRVEKYDGEYNWSDFEKSPLIKTKSLSLGVERGEITKQLKVDPDVILNYFLHPRNRSSIRLSSSLGSGVYELAEDLTRHIRGWQQTSSYRTNRSELKFDTPHANLQNIKMENVEKILLDRYKFARELATEKIQDALFNTLAEELSNEGGPRENMAVEEFIPELKKNRLRLIEALSDNSKNKFKNTIISTLEDLDNEESYHQVYTRKSLTTLLWNMMLELRFENFLLRSVNLLIEKFNYYLIDGKKLQISKGRIFIESDTQELPLSSLSSGERHILTFLTLVLFQGSERNFLLIDEPEISLNPKWQRELMELLHNLAPKTQIIVASHSPFLVNNNQPSLSEVVLKKDGPW